MKYNHILKSGLVLISLPFLTQALTSSIQPKKFFSQTLFSFSKVALIRSLFLGFFKYQEYEADSHALEYTTSPQALRATADFLRNNYYKTYTSKATSIRNKYEKIMCKIPMNADLKNKISYAIEKIALKWVCINNVHPHPFSRAMRFEKKAQELEKHSKVD